MTLTDRDLRDRAKAIFDRFCAATAPDRASEIQAEYDALNAPAPLALVDEDDNVVGMATCGKSGAPVWNDDEFLDDSETGEVFLRSALGLPPRQLGEA